MPPSWSTSSPPRSGCQVRTPATVGRGPRGRPRHRLPRDQGRGRGGPLRPGRGPASPPDLAICFIISRERCIPPWEGPTPHPSIAEQDRRRQRSSAASLPSSLSEARTCPCSGSRGRRMSASGRRLADGSSKADLLAFPLSRASFVAALQLGAEGSWEATDEAIIGELEERLAPAVRAGEPGCDPQTRAPSLERAPSMPCWTDRPPARALRGGRQDRGQPPHQHHRRWRVAVRAHRCQDRGAGGSAW